MSVHKFTADEKGVRLDIYLAKNIQLNRSQIKNAINEERIKVNDKSMKAGHKLKIGDEIMYIESEPYVIVPKNLSIPVLYEDEDIACIDKPYGLVVHPGAAQEEETLVHDLIYRFKHLAKGSDPLRPGIVHRLDKDTSGVMIIAKTDEAYYKLIEDFKYRRLKKYYYAVCRGVIDTSGTINSPIGRDPNRRMQMAVNVHPSKEALTSYKPIMSFRDTSFIELRIFTGRTHQIRVHMRSINHPIVGDPIYGIKNDKNRQLLLHSHCLCFNHPISNNEMIIKASLPRRIQSYIQNEERKQCIKY